jgi:hypothetical protein
MADSSDTPKKLPENVVFYPVKNGNRYIAQVDSFDEAQNALRVLKAAIPNHRCDGDTHYISVRSDRLENLKEVLTTPINTNPLIKPKHLEAVAEAFDEDKPIAAIGAVVNTGHQELQAATRESGHGGIGH